LRGDINIAKGLELNLRGLATNVESHGASANLRKRGLGSVIVPADSARLPSLASGGGNRSGNVEGGKSLGSKGGKERNGEDGGEHG